MKQNDIATGAQLEAQLAISELNARTQLWKFAEGRFDWPVRIAGIVPVLIVLVGLVLRLLESGLAGFMGKDPASYFIVLGVSLVGLNLWSNTQRQISAMRVLLKDIERSRPQARRETIQPQPAASS